METPRIVSIDDEREHRERRGKMEDLAGLLSRSEKGVPLPTVSNAIMILDHDPMLSGLVAFDEFTNSHVLLRTPPSPMDNQKEAPGPYPRPWVSSDVSWVQSYIQRIHSRSMGKSDTDDAMRAVSSANRFHPVRDWLNKLKWDGTNRLETWLTDVFGTPNDDYHRTIGMNFLVGAVRRIIDPGCKFDNMIILEGNQRIGKSTAVKMLFGEKWFTDSIPTKLDSKDAAFALQGIWVGEFAEIEHLIRTDIEIIKSFLSRSVDRFRAPYGREFLTYPRQCVLIGTTNETEYLRDPTGNTRFWPVNCERVNLNWIEAFREQLWAEASYLESIKTTHWEFNDVAAARATEVQLERVQEDVWEDKIRDALVSRSEVTIPQVLSEVLMIVHALQTKREQMRVAAILKREGWVKVVRWKESGSIKIWERGGKNQ